jgi:diamine N-acetyltransferase
MRVLRPMVEEDLDDVLPLQREAAVVALGHIFPQDEHPFPSDEVRKRWIGEIESSDVDCFVVLGPQGETAGFAATRADELLHFGTAIRLWGSGLAGRAHDEILDHLRDKGFAEAWLRVFEENHRGRRFYERRAWVATGERTRTSFAPHPVLVHYLRSLR